MPSRPTSERRGGPMPSKSKRAPGVSSCAFGGPLERGVRDMRAGAHGANNRHTGAQFEKKPRLGERVVGASTAPESAQDTASSASSTALPISISELPKLNQAQISELYRLVARIKHLYLAAHLRWVPADKRAEMLQPELRYAVARCGAKLAGFVSWEMTQEGAYIWELHVAPQFKRRGLGTRLLELVENEGVVAGADGIQPSPSPSPGPVPPGAHVRARRSLTLRTFTINKSAVALYERCGFSIQEQQGSTLIMIKYIA